MRTLKTLAASAALLLVAGTANAGLIIELQANGSNFFGNGQTEIEVHLTLVGGEGLSSLGFDMIFGGTGTNALTQGSGVQAAGTQHCQNSGFGAADCSISGLTPPNADGTNYNWATTGTGPRGGPNPSDTFTWFAGLQEITLGTWNGQADVVIGGAFNNAGNPITDITVIDIVPEPTTAALLGLGLFGLALGGRRR